MGKREIVEEKKLKKLIYIFSFALVCSIIIFLTIFIMYNRKLKKESNDSLINLGKMNGIVSNEELEETSFSSDKTVSNSVNTVENKIANNVNNVNSSSNKKKNIVNKTPVEAAIENKVTNTVANNIVENNTANENCINENVVQELSFIAPVAGDIIKDFATDTLIYSNTLEEWTTHTGIDIKADKTSIVVASEAGTVESIKNDPRYGLTIIINHGNGFKTVYSNLLTTEFVSENEKVEKGQTIGTVGETASFEVADESHLHFEMYKDGSSVNPTIYLK